jgi:hypothetical protein
MSRPAVEFAEANAGHAQALVRALRQQDRAELDASGQTDHLAAVWQSVEQSDWAVAAYVDGQLVCLFGVAAHAARGTGVPWMLGTDLVAQQRRFLLRLAPTYIARMLAAYPRLFNAVHARNTVSVRWLRHVGFRLHPSQPHPRTGEPFIPFEMTR